MIQLRIASLPSQTRFILLLLLYWKNTT